MASFERVYFEMPGEIAPRLAMGFAAEVAGMHDQAVAYFDRVGRVDPSYITANFGLARCHAAKGDFDLAVAALTRVPENHALRTIAMLAVAELALQRHDKLDTDLLQAAEAALRAALPEGGIAHKIAGQLLANVVALMPRKRFSWRTDAPFLGQQFTERALRQSAEEQFRKAAKLANDTAERIHWITQANRVRPVSFV